MRRVIAALVFLVCAFFLITNLTASASLVWSLFYGSLAVIMVPVIIRGRAYGDPRNKKVARNDSKEIK